MDICATAYNCSLFARRFVYLFKLLELWRLQQRILFASSCAVLSNLVSRLSDERHVARELLLARNQFLYRQTTDSCFVITIEDSGICHDWRYFSRRVHHQHDESRAISLVQFRGRS